jgi:hypothetical protein
MRVKFSTISTYILEFDDKEEFEEWENRGACVDPDECTIISEQTEDEWRVQE